MSRSMVIINGDVSEDVEFKTINPGIVDTKPIFS